MTFLSLYGIPFTNIENILVGITILLLITFSIVFFIIRVGAKQEFARCKLLTSITREFKKPFHLRRVFTGVIDLLLLAMPSIKGGMLIVYGKTPEADKLRIIRGMTIGKSKNKQLGLDFRNRLQKIAPLVLSSEDFSDDNNKQFKSMTFFPIVVRHHVVGTLGVGSFHKKISRQDTAFLQIVLSAISLEFEDRLLQTRLDAFSKGLSLVEYSYESIVDNLPSGVVVMDPDRQIILFNNTMKSIARIDEPIGRDYLDIFPHKDTKEEIREFLVKMQRTQLLTATENFIYKVGHVMKVLSITGYPLFDVQNNIVAYIIIHEDITEKYFLSEKLKETQEKAHKELQEKIKLATRELVDANKELIRLNKLKSEFVAVISHELKTPLTSIKGYVKLLESGKLGAISVKQKDSLHIVSSESDRLANLINDVLDLSKLESGKSTLKLDKTMIYKLLSEVVSIMAPQAKAKKIVLDCECKTCPVCKKEIPMDSAKIKQAIINLVGNAIKFTPPKGKVKMDVIERRDALDIVISDTGIGISKEDQFHLFEPFYQAQDHLTRDVKGTGLGLTITKHIINMHHGSIKVKSKIGKGTSVTLRLPKNLDKLIKG
jgi:PAS domain S-box-containing protein